MQGCEFDALPPAHRAPGSAPSAGRWSWTARRPPRLQTPSGSDPCAHSADLPLSPLLALNHNQEGDGSKQHQPSGRNVRQTSPHARDVPKLPLFDEQIIAPIPQIQATEVRVGRCQLVCKKDLLHCVYTTSCDLGLLLGQQQPLQWDELWGSRNSLCSCMVAASLDTSLVSIMCFVIL